MHRWALSDVDLAGVTAASEELSGVREALPHSHDFYELVTVLAGRALHVSAGGMRVLATGDLVVLRPGEWHSYEDGEGLAVVNLYLDPRYLSRQRAWLGQEPAISRLLGAADAAHASARATGDVLADLAIWQQQLNRWNTTMSRSVASGLVACVLGAFARTLIGPTAGSPGRPEVLRAVELLEGDVARPWRVLDLARATHLSLSTLERLFAEQVGVPPMVYLARARAERAAALLLSGDQPVQAIGVAVGWADPNYMSRRFRLHFGMSPTEYRRKFRLQG